MPHSVRFETATVAFNADRGAPNYAEPAFAFGFDDAGFEVVVDLFEPGPLGGVRPEERASDTGVLMDAGRGECSGAGSDRDLAFFEVGEEGIPFGVGGCAVFLAGSGSAAAGDV
ncbi:hypothetical protein [Nocardia australiensis]|uniref:hypothetical protein n=1 Tax=Nocardia australiensis TaxID=2887191 RepID=UPI001D157BCB|nr:hypothetical protein [Nocardia australiensis]